jgi:hypothetical protein
LHEQLYTITDKTQEDCAASAGLNLLATNDQRLNRPSLIFKFFPAAKIPS